MAAEQQPDHLPYIVVRSDRPLIGVMTPEHGSDDVIYFTDEEAADESTTATTIETALSLAGVWSDISWDEIEAGLQQIRHASEPSPPLEP